MTRILAICFAITVLCPLLSAPVRGDQLLVNSPRDGHDAVPGDSICADSLGRCSLRAAVEEASAGPVNTIRIPAAKIDLWRDFPPLPVTGDVTIIGAGAGETRVSGSRRNRVFEVSQGASLSLQDLSIEKGVLSLRKTPPDEQNGAAIRSNGSLTLTRVRLKGNKARDGFGGAIYAAGVVSMFESECVSNSASAGGCVYVSATGTLIVDGDLFRKNRAFFGGGGGAFIECGSSGHEIRRLTTVHNTARKGFSPDYNTPFNDDGGAGGLNVCGDGLIENSTLFHDRCRRCGPGALRVRGGNWLLDHVLFKDNQAAFFTAGAYVDEGASVQARACVFEGNDAVDRDTPDTLHSGNCLGTMTSLGFNIERHVPAQLPSCGLDQPTDLTYLSASRLYLDPKTRTEWTAWPIAGSPLIDFIEDGECQIATDELKQPRPMDGDGDGTARCDAGPIEIPGSPPPTPTAIETPTPVDTATDTPTAVDTPTDTPTP